MLNKIKRQAFSKFVSITTIAAVLTLSGATNLAVASSMTSSKDTATRLKISQQADHVITTTMPTSITFDVSTNQDGFQFDFPSSFTLAGTWATSDFAFSDSAGAHTVEAVAQGAGTITCTSTTAENVCVAVDTTNNIFTVKPSTSYTASSAASAVTFTILGTGGGGTMSNPSSVAATNIDFKMCDEQSGCFTTFVATHSSQIAFAVADDEQVSVSATVNATISFDLDTKSDFTNGESSAPYTVAFGTLSTTDVKSSGTTDSVQMIVAEADSNATGGVVVTVANANGANGMKSTSTPSDDINSADGTMGSSPVENYGLCVATSGLSGFSRASPYNSGTCAVDGEVNDIQGLTSTGENILSTSGPVAAAHAEIVANAFISGTTVAHADYADTLTLIATGTF